ncbi:MAG: HRDC domain-containing protein [Spirochaetes bacterium]|nr:HRDC domain-containing protein [Spirochaetota bacterium]
MNYTLVDTQEGIGAMAGSLEGAAAIAVDVECTSSLHHYGNRVCLIQLSAGGEIFIVDTLADMDIACIGRILEDPAVEIVMHDTDFDLRSLDRQYGWHPHNVFDTLIAARLCGHKEFGLASLLEKYFGIQRSKKFQRADWTIRPLPDEMLQYAAGDVEELLRLCRLLAGELENLGRMEWARTEFAQCEEKRYVPDGRPHFARVKRARELCDGRELATLNELATVREGIAEELDLPLFKVIGDEPLIALAKRPPRSAGELKSRRGLHPLCRSRYAGRIMEALRRGRNAPAPRWPHSGDRRGYSGRLFNDLKDWRGDYAAELNVDPDLVLSMDSLRDLARGDEIAAVLRKEPIHVWRGDEIRRQVAEILSGHRSRT